VNFSATIKVIWQFGQNPPSSIWRYSDGLSKLLLPPSSVIWYLNVP